MTIPRCAVPAIAALLLLGLAGCTSGSSFAPTSCVVTSISVNRRVVQAPRLGALIRFTSSGQLKIHGRAGSQADDTVRYLVDGSGYEATDFRGAFGYYDNFVAYDSALDDLLSGHVSVTRKHHELTMSVNRDAVHCRTP